MGADHEHAHNDYELHDHHHDHDHHDHDHHGHDHHDHVHGGGDMEVHVGHKAAALCVMAVATLIASFAPIYIRKKINKKSNNKRSEMFLTGLLCCGAGVLLATVFLHILPETSHSIRDAMKGGFISEIEFPITELLLCCGFFLIYLIEEVVHNCLGHSHNNNDATSVSTVSIKNISTVEDGMSRNDTTNIKENNKSSGFYNNGFQEEFEQDSNQSPTSNNDSSSHSHSTLIKADSSVLKAIFVVAAISIHSIMEGIAIGVEEHVMDMWLLMGAICMHKLIIAFSIGMELLQEGVKRIPFFAAMIIFSLASPLGGVIGTLSFSVKVKTTAGIMVNAVLQGLAGGSILYIIFCEILERERARQKGGYIIVITLMLGFGLMCGVQLIPGHSHSH